MIVVGLAMLLSPGICVLFVASSNPEAFRRDPAGLIKLLAIAAVGVALLWAAFRRPSR
jgi:hypothetical protein